MSAKLKAALREAPEPTAELLTAAFDIVHPAEGTDRRARFLRFLSVDGWRDAAWLVVPEGMVVCLSEQAPPGGWCGLAVGRAVSVREWLHHGKARTGPTAICVAALEAHEAQAAG